MKKLLRQFFAFIIVFVIFLSPLTGLAHPFYSYNDVFYQNSWQWGLDAVGSHDLASNPRIASNLANVTVAIIDTGLDVTHPEFANHVVSPRNFTGVGGETDVTDETGHGTHVAGIIGAQANNKIGIAGVASGVNIMPIKIISPQSSNGVSALIKAIHYAADNGADVINMSISVASDGVSSGLLNAISYARDKGITLVAAAGNDSNPSNISAPASINGVIAVGATNYGNVGMGVIAFYETAFSNYNPYLNSRIVYAPGVDILSTFPQKLADNSDTKILQGSDNDAYTFMNGTSMATAFASGVAALVKANGDQKMSTSYPQQSYNSDSVGNISATNREKMNILSVTGEPPADEFIAYNKARMNNVSMSSQQAVGKKVPVSVNFNLSDTLPAVVNDGAGKPTARVGVYHVKAVTNELGRVIRYERDGSTVFTNANNGSTTAWLDFSGGVDDDNLFAFYVENNGTHLASERLVYNFSRKLVEKSLKFALSENSPSAIAAMSPAPTNSAAGSLSGNGTKSFGDMPSSHWAAGIVSDLSSLGIVSGDNAGNFNPDVNVTRAEFVKMIFGLGNGVGVRSFVSSTSNAKLSAINPCFDDVSPDLWFYSYVTWAVENNLINGYDSSTFAPGEPITREEMATIAYRFALTHGAGSVANVQSSDEFADSAAFSGWAHEAINAVRKIGLIAGFEDYTFRPDANTTRAQAAAVAWNIYDKLLKTT